MSESNQDCTDCSNSDIELSEPSYQCFKNHRCKWDGKLETFTPLAKHCKDYLDLYPDG